ncbi:MAG: molybdopterin biosynthesis protein [Desulfurococcaceae archaeon]
MAVKVFHELSSLNEAVEKVIKKANPQPRGLELVRLEDALFRVLARDLYASVDYPPFDRSEVDGYAVKSDKVMHATEVNPVILRVLGELKTGERGEDFSCEEGAIKVSTGAVIPRDCDAVVMEEYTEALDDVVKVYRPVAPGENISTTGSDVSAGDFMLPRGTLLRHEHIALLAGFGLLEVPVYVKPKIAVYSTGNEVVEPGKPLEQGKVYDVNGLLISSFLREWGADATYRGILPDDYKVIRSVIEEDLEHYDAVFTSGGTSAGEMDLVYRVFEDVGEVIVHGLKSRPGKPTLIATTDKGKLLFGLPGFPLSCYMILVRVVKPIITRLTGLRYVETRIDVRIPVKIRKGVGKTWLIPSILVESSHGYTAYPVSLSSGSVYAITYSDGFIELDENTDYFEAGTLVPFYPFSEKAPLRRLTIIGSNDPLLEHILVRSGLIYTSRILNTGSVGGWIATSRGEADIAPTHLLDPESGTYNVPFLEKYGLTREATIIRGYDRLVGIIVARGNPKKIKGFEDFLRSDVRIVNRPRGSGIRALVDINLKSIAEKHGIQWSSVPRLVKGYTYEVKTHTAVAIAIKHGKADAGVAVGYVADIHDLDFIPITWEEFDFLVLRNKLKKGEVKKFIEALRNLDLTAMRDFKLHKYYRVPGNAGYPRSEAF